MKNIRIFYLVVKFPVYLNGHVFIMHNGILVITRIQTTKNCNRRTVLEKSAKKKKKKKKKIKALTALVGKLSLSVGCENRPTRDLRLFHFILYFLQFKQTEQTLIRRHVLRRLICICIVCQCPKCLSPGFLQIILNQQYSDVTATRKARL